MEFNLSVLKWNFLFASATDAYQSADWVKAAVLFLGAVDYSREFLEAEYLLESLYWYANSSREAGYLKRAIAGYSEAIQIDRDLEQKYSNKLLAGFLETAIDIPTSISSIEKSLNTLSRLLESTSPAEKGIIDYFKSDIYSIQGDFVKAFSCIQKAFIVYKESLSHNVNDEYLKRIVESAIMSGNKDIALKVLRSWDSFDILNQGYRIYCKNVLMVLYYRSVGDISSSLEIAKNYAPYDSRQPYYLIECMIIAGESDMCKRYLVEFLYQMRNSDSYFQRLKCYLYLGDYYHSLIRKEISGSSIDFKFNIKYKLNVELNKNVSDVVKGNLIKMKNKSHLYYSYALNLCQEIDELFMTKYNSNLINQRIILLNELII